MPIPALVFKSIKMAAPQLDDQQTVQIWDKLLETVPQAQDMPPEQIAQIVGKMAQQSPSRSAYAGTAMEQRNPQNPQAAHMDQFDPKAQDAALADYNQRYQASLPQRNMSQLVASRGGPDVVEAGRKAWGDVDAYNKLQSLDQQTRKEAQATAGLAAGTSVLGQFGKQQENAQAAQKTESAGIDLAAKKRANTPNNPLAGLVLESAKAQYRAANDGKDPPPEVLSKLQGLTQVELMQFATPSFIKAWQEIQAGRKAQAEGTIGEAVAGSVANEPKSKVKPSDAKFDFKPGTNLEVIRSVLARQGNEADLAAFDAQFPDVAKPPADNKATLKPEAAKKMQFATTNFGGVSIPPDPRIVAGAGNEAAAAGSAEQRFRTYDTELAPTLKSLRQKLESAGTGKGTQAIAAWWPGNQTQELVNLLNRANTLYPGVLSGVGGGQMANEIAKGGFNGNLVGSMTTDQVRNAIQLIEQTQAKDRQYQVNLNKGQATNTPGQFGANQEIPDTTPKTAGGMPTIRNKDDYDKLFPGESYIDGRDGQQKRKKK